MRILEATLGAADPAGLGAWYAATLGVSTPAFAAGFGGSHHFAFHVGDLEPWKVPLDATREYDFADWGGARAVYFRDPAGNVAELIARPTPQPELTLAEVGLPVKDVGAAVGALERQLGLALYDGDRETFAAVGDDDGLLIVVREGRNWFPLDVPTSASPVSVTISSAVTGELVVPGSAHRVVSR